MNSGLKIVGVMGALILMGLTINAWGERPTQTPTPIPTPTPTPANQAGQSGGALVDIVDGRNAHLNSEILIGLYRTFGKEALDSLAAEGLGFPAKFKLYLNGVAMNGLEPPRPLSPQPGAAPSTVYMTFRLNRDSHNDENRKSWNRFLSGVQPGSNSVKVGVSFNGGLIHESGNELEYSTASPRLIWTLLVLGLLVLWGGMRALVFSKTMLRDNGEGTPYSLGKTQMALWGLLVVLSFVGVLVLSGQMERIPEQTLMLLGISGATGALSLMIASDKRSGNTAIEALEASARQLSDEILALEAKAGEPAFGLTETQLMAAKRTALADVRIQIARESAAKPRVSTGKWLRDIISDENGPSFHRLQVVIWTAILASVFVWTVANTFSMPEFDKTLVILLGISNGTYLGFKFKEG